MSAAFTVQLNEESRFVPMLNVGHRSQPCLLNVAAVGENVYRDFVVSAFGGENEVSLYATSIQGGSTDVVMLHAQCDNPLVVFHKRFCPQDGSLSEMLTQINQQIADWLD